MDAVKLLANYILCLEQSAATTARAEDRPGYAQLLADAGPMLAAALESPAHSSMAIRISRHEKLWGNLWLQDPAFCRASHAWQAARAACSRAAT